MSQCNLIGSFGILFGQVFSMICNSCLFTIFTTLKKVFSLLCPISISFSSFFVAVFVFKETFGNALIYSFNMVTKTEILWKYSKMTIKCTLIRIWRSTSVVSIETPKRALYHESLILNEFGFRCFPFQKHFRTQLMLLFCLIPKKSLTTTILHAFIMPISQSRGGQAWPMSCNFLFKVQDG